MYPDSYKILDDGNLLYQSALLRPFLFYISFIHLSLQILRLMKGYDTHNILLLPPRAPGEPLPAELLEYYQEHRSRNPESGIIKSISNKANSI